MIQKQGNKYPQVTKEILDIPSKRSLSLTSGFIFSLGYPAFLRMPNWVSCWIDLPASLDF